MKITIAKVILCAILVVTMATTAMVTLPNHDSLNNNSVKSTVDEVTKSESISIILATQPTTKTSNKTPQSTQPTKVSVTEKPTEVVTEAVTEVEEVVEPEIEKSEIEQGDVSESDNSYYYDDDADYDTLLDIDNPDSSYVPQAIDISNGEREEIARVVMGEFGGGGFTGCALIAQCIRDAMARYGYDGYEVRSAMQYYGYNSSPSSTAYEAVDWIFVGNAAVNHRILVMNNSSGGWHGTQNFVVCYQGVWFYDLWW